MVVNLHDFFLHLYMHIILTWCHYHRIIAWFPPVIHKVLTQMHRAQSFSTATRTWRLSFQPWCCTATQQQSIFPSSEQHRLCFCRFAHVSQQKMSHLEKSYNHLSPRNRIVS